VIELNEIESQYLNLVIDKISIRDFENWVYNSKWLENELTSDEYTELISLNYNNPSAKYEVGKILNKRIAEGKLETVKMINLLNSIIERDGKEGESLIQMYDHYCNGYNFLVDLGLGIGLYIISPLHYGVDYYHELAEDRKKEVIDRVYPSARKLAEELKNWLLAGDIKLTGERDLDLSHWQYIDNRTDEDKISRVWKTADVDQKTGEVKSKVNQLLNEHGEFHSDDSWIEKILKKIMPNR
jgi:hypothetical protein